MKATQRLQKVQERGLSEFFDGHDVGLDPWNTSRWKERSEEIRSARTNCEWCGDELEAGHVHHLIETPSWGRAWRRAADRAFIRSEAFSDNLVKDREECPKCGLRSYYGRKQKTPTYRCNECKESFEQPKTVPGGQVVIDTSRNTTPYLTGDYYEKKANWVENNTSAIKSEFSTWFDGITEEYFTTDEFVVICDRCHYNEEQTRNTRCDNCESWHAPNKPMCWDCLVEEKGLEECSCGDGWYQPDKYNECSACR